MFSTNRTVGSFPMNETCLLFVYGLLRRGQSGHDDLGLEGRVHYLGSDRVQGQIYHLGDYPGMVTGSHGIVHGDLLAIEDVALLHDMDAYELFDPDQPDSSEYRRIEVDLLDSGKRAWAYEYNRPVAGLPIVAGGDWQRS